MGTTEIRESTPEDAAAIESLYPQAFPHEDLVPLVQCLLDDPVVAESLVATCGREIVGHAIFTRCGITGSNLNAVLIGPLAVAPDYQRRGVGSALMHDGLKRMRDEGVDVVCLLGDPRYYRRFGFVTETLVEPPYPIPAAWCNAWQSIWLGERDASLSAKLAVPRQWRDPALWAP